MADFCNQCAKKLSLKPGDFAGLISKRNFLHGFRAQVLCEGCGWTYVDHLGNSIHWDEEKFNSMNNDGPEAAA